MSRLDVTSCIERNSHAKHLAHSLVIDRGSAVHVRAEAIRNYSSGALGSRCKRRFAS